MMIDGGRNGGGVSRHGKANGFIPSSFQALSSYQRIVSSRASTVARSAVSVASSIMERDGDGNHDQCLELYIHGIIFAAGLEVLVGEDRNRAAKGKTVNAD